MNAKTPSPGSSDEPFIPYGRQSLDESDITAVAEALRSEFLTSGPRVPDFEEALAAYCGATYAVAVSSGTAALHVAMLAAGIGEGDRVLTSANTFLASANCAEFTGASVDFVDIDPVSHNLCPDALAGCLQPGVKAVVAVDFAGQPCDVVRIAEAARRQGALVIEDGCHAIGSSFRAGDKTVRVGGHPWADLTTLSFHPVKTLTSGEGGAVLTDDGGLAGRCRLFRNHGMVRNDRISEAQGPWFYEMSELGFNYRITDIHCALGRSQLNKIDAFIGRRQAIVDAYNAAFSGCTNVRTPSVAAGGGHSMHSISPAWHLYVVEIDFQHLGKSRARVMEELRHRGVGTQVHYIPVYLQPYYRMKYGYGPGKCPVAESYYAQALSLPLFPAMDDHSVSRVIAAVKEIVG